MKTCTKCGIEKEESEFGKGKNYKDGLQYYCKKCMCIMAKEIVEKKIEKEGRKDYYKKRYAENKENNKARVKKWYFNNSDKAKEYARKYRSENKEKVLQNTRDWFKINEDKRKQYSEKKRIYNLENPEISKKVNKETYKSKSEYYKFHSAKQRLTKQIGETPPPELVEVKLLINKTKRLCKTLKSCETH